MVDSVVFKAKDKMQYTERDLMQLDGRGCLSIEFRLAGLLIAAGPAILYHSHRLRPHSGTSNDIKEVRGCQRPASFHAP
jgi:hypothetical protein